MPSFVSLQMPIELGYVHDEIVDKEASRNGSDIFLQASRALPAVRLSISKLERYGLLRANEIARFSKSKVTEYTIL